MYIKTFENPAKRVLFSLLSKTVKKIHSRKVIEMERFQEVSDSEFQAILDERKSQNTKKATANSWNIFQQYCDFKQTRHDVHNKVEMDELLSKFYVEVRKQDGSFYSQTIRSGLQRKFQEDDLTIDIVNDTAFKQSNVVFQAQLVQLKKKGFGKVNHKPSITDNDLEKLYQSCAFKQDNPQTLQNKVFFDIMLYLCRRGRENLRELNKDSFSLKMFPDGTEYVMKTEDELTKNHRENDTTQDNEGGIMMATGDSNCPVKSFKLYISKLNPKLETFFQRPKAVINEDGPWYDAQVVGVKTIGNWMKRISERASLSKVYTNHSIRATSITLLDKKGLEARHIMSVSGHKSETSIRSYSKTETKRKMSSIISESSNGQGSSKKPKHFDLGVFESHSGNDESDNDDSKKLLASRCQNVTF